jgi:hypothetical protein
LASSMPRTRALKTPAKVRSTTRRLRSVDNRPRQLGLRAPLRVEHSTYRHGPDRLSTSKRSSDDPMREIRSFSCNRPGLGGLAADARTSSYAPSRSRSRIGFDARASTNAGLRPLMAVRPLLAGKRLASASPRTRYHQVLHRRRQKRDPALLPSTDPRGSAALTEAFHTPGADETELRRAPLAAGPRSETRSCTSRGSPGRSDRAPAVSSRSSGC